MTDTGVVYGTYADANSFQRSFTFTNGIFSDFNLTLVPTGVNNLGVIAGYGYCAATFSGCIPQPDGTITSYPDVLLNDINDLGAAVGSQNGRAILLENGVIQDLGIPGESTATGINDLGQVVGWYRSNGFGSFLHGFVWQSGSYYTLDAPYGSGGQSLNGINNSGIIAADDYVYVGGAWVYLGVPESGWQMQLHGINNLGTMVGHNGFQGVIVAPQVAVPEASTFSATALGFVAIAGLLRRLSWR